MPSAETPRTIRALQNAGVPIVLIGLPGSGKTTISGYLAERLGWERLDLDEEIEARCEMTIPDIFAQLGEGDFRELEYEAASGVFESPEPQVVGSGGGAPVYLPTRDLFSYAAVVYLKVDPQCAADRVGQAEGRPLLEQGDSVLARVEQLEHDRHRIYEETATVSVDATKSIPEVVQEVIDALEAADLRQLIGAHEEKFPAKFQGDRHSSEVKKRVYEPDQNLELPAKENGKWRIPVTGAGDYAVTIGRDLLAPISASFREDTAQILLVHPDSVAGSAQKLRDRLQADGFEVVDFVHPDGEAAKDYQVVLDAYQMLGDMRFSRTDAVLALGGGATTDVGGYIAATWLRGIDLVNVPTTLLGMVDAALGGKTGINTPHGKNLVGSFYPPRAVVCDLDYLKTISEHDIRSGLGEVVKCGFIRDPKILELVKAEQGRTALDVSSDALAELVARAVQVKAHVVSADLREGAIREILNYGHTLGHAIERAEGYRWRHGDAVAVGMVFAAAVATELGLAPANWADTHREYLNYLGLPTSYQGAAWGLIYHHMTADKKVRSRTTRFVLCEPGQRVQVMYLHSQKFLARLFEKEIRLKK